MHPAGRNAPRPRRSALGRRPGPPRPVAAPRLYIDLKKAGIWDDLGKLKRWLADDLTRERNTYAREVMTEIKAIITSK